jgi:uncharacterized membrane protein
VQLRVAAMPGHDHGAEEAEAEEEARRGERTGWETFGESPGTPREEPAMIRRVISVASLVSGLVAFYLHLWKFGKVAALACGGGTRGCNYVQNSAYGTFMGVDVALIGTWGYAAIFVVATLGSLSRFENERWPTYVLMVLIWPAVLFTIRLKYYEFFVLRGFCPWCLVSAVTITLCAVLVTFDRRRFESPEL